MAGRFWPIAVDGYNDWTSWSRCWIDWSTSLEYADLVLDHEIPHIWVRRNELTDRKTLTSIRCIPLLGVSLDAARELHKRATEQKSEWLISQYANEIGNSTCSATLNMCMKHLNFRTHMFRHAFIDRLKGCGDIPGLDPVFQYRRYV